MPRALKVLRSIGTASHFCRAARHPLILVPTMGALHRGHGALIDRARRIAGGRGTVVVSVFVNPTQFGPTEDFARYPRRFVADCALCEHHGANAIFHPAPAAMYPPDFSTWVDEESLSRQLCGAARPGHFRGVCTVVMKLFMMTRPEVAVFGWKDLQQCLVVRRMVRDLGLPMRIVAIETVREPDGLALSSRNVYLSAEERAQASVLRRALLVARAAFRRGVTDAQTLRKLVLQTIAGAPLARVDYVEIADVETLRAISIVDRRCVIALAVFFGQTRLIDNIRLS
jgi:pantoate--beta-alanine ligase